jgi:hypothetical protein
MLSMTTHQRSRDLTKYFQPLLQQKGRGAALVQRALFTQKKKAAELKEVTAEIIDEVLFDMKLQDSAAQARKRSSSPLHAAQYRINVARLASIGDTGLLLELQSCRKLDPKQPLQQEWPEKDFDVILHEDGHGWRSIHYLEPTMQTWNLDMSHPIIHTVWTLYRSVGIYVDLSTV